MQKLPGPKIVRTLPSSLPALSCVFNLLPVPLTSQRCKLLTGRSALWPCQGASLSHPFLDQKQVTTRADRGALHAPNHLTQTGGFQSTFSPSPGHSLQRVLSSQNRASSPGTALTPLGHTHLVPAERLDQGCERKRTRETPRQLQLDAVGDN